MIKQKNSISFYNSVIILLLVIAGDMGVQVIASVLIVFAQTSGLSYMIVNYIAMILLQVVFALIVLFALKKKSLTLDTFPFGGERPKPKALIIQLLCGIAITLVSLLTFYQPALLFDMVLQRIGYITEDAFGFGSNAELVLLFFVTCILAPIVEETIFRGVLLSGQRKIMDKWSAVILNGLTFSLFHMNPSQTVYQFFLGCGFALIAYESGSLLPGMIAHFANNFFAVLLMISPALNNGFETIMEFFVTGWGIALVIPMVIIGLIGIYYISKLTGSGKPKEKQKLFTMLPMQTEQESDIVSEDNDNCEVGERIGDEAVQPLDLNAIYLKLIERKNKQAELTKQKKQRRSAMYFYMMILIFCQIMWILVFLSNLFLSNIAGV